MFSGAVEDLSSAITEEMAQETANETATTLEKEMTDPIDTGKLSANPTILEEENNEIADEITRARSNAMPGGGDGDELAEEMTTRARSGAIEEKPVHPKLESLMAEKGLIGENQTAAEALKSLTGGSNDAKLLDIMSDLKKGTAEEQKLMSNT